MCRSLIKVVILLYYTDPLCLRCCTFCFAVQANDMSIIRPHEAGLQYRAVLYICACAGMPLGDVAKKERDKNGN